MRWFLKRLAVVVLVFSLLCLGMILFARSQLPERRDPDEIAADLEAEADGRYIEPLARIHSD